MRILIVDDEGSLLVTLVANLEIEGFDVIGVQDAATALRLIREQRFDLVLTDIRMPGMSGVELFRAIRSLRADMPVLLMTAFAAETVIDEAIQEGVFAVLPKPFDIEHVIFALSRAASHPMVLLVDDAAEATPTVEALRAVGLASCIASGHEATVLAIQERRADVALVNVALAGGGPALVERILRFDASIAVIAISGARRPNFSGESQNLGHLLAWSNLWSPRGWFSSSRAQGAGRSVPRSVQQPRMGAEMGFSAGNQQRSNPAGQKKYSVLVVDDDPNVLTSIIRLLSDDADVPAPSGERALELLKVRNFHVVISDFAMPGMDGNALFGRIGLMPEYVSCLLLTGSDRYQPLAGEIRHYVLFKPFDPERLIRLVTELGRVAEMKRSVKLMTDSISESRIKID